MKQHPLSAAFPAMGADEFEAIRDGVIPASDEVLTALLASKWFQGLTSSQRAMHAVSWFNHLSVGSNQHQQRIKTSTPRFAAEAAVAAIGRASA